MRFSPSHKEISYEQKAYVILTALFVTLSVTSNLICRKFVRLPLGFHVFELSVGVLFYPILFFITGLITEFYGKKAARFSVNVSVCLVFVMAFLVKVATKLEAISWSPVSGQEFENIFGFYEKSFLASLIANYVSQRIEIALYEKLRQMTCGRWIGLRSFASTSISLGCDTAIVVSMLVYFGAVPLPQWLHIILQSYSFKICFVLCMSPIFVLIVKGFPRIQGPAQKYSLSASPNTSP